MSFCPEVEAQLVHVAAMDPQLRAQVLEYRQKRMAKISTRIRQMDAAPAGKPWVDMPSNTPAFSSYTMGVSRLGRHVNVLAYELQAYVLRIHQLATGNAVLRDAAPYCPCECLCVANRQRLKHLLVANTCPFRGCGESDGSAMHWQAHIDAGDLLDKQLLITAHMTRAPPVNEAAAKRRRVTVTDAEVAESLSQLNEAQV
jgi:hypothetical protein